MKPINLAFFTALLVSLDVCSAFAQLIPDQTLGNEKSKINAIDTLNDRVNGGAIRGQTLFHSFIEFNIGKGRSVYFDQSNAINRIVTRVTGSNLSNISGKLGVQGSADLFILNPNGFVFGPTSSLDVKGSFLAATASNIEFDNGFKFSADQPNQVPKLTIKQPIGLNFWGISGPITVANTGHDVRNASAFSPLQKSDKPGLRVLGDQNLAFLGGDINFTGGITTAPTGGINVTSIRRGTAGLTQRQVIDTTQVMEYGEITLDFKSLIDADFIHLEGRNITVRGGSLIQNESLITPRTGNLSLRAIGQLEVAGIASDGSLRSSISSASLGKTPGASISVSANHLIVDQGGVIGVRNFGAAQGGDLKIDASKVQVSGFSPLSPLLFSSIVTVTLNSGDAGDLSIRTNALSLTNGGVIATSTLGNGNSGDIAIRGTDITLKGLNPGTFTPSAISSATFSNGNAGNIFIDTAKLIVQGGARIGSSSVSSGNAGNLNVQASDFVKISGPRLSQIVPSTIDSGVILDPTLQPIFGLPSIPSGDSGNVTINTPKLYVQDGGQISVRNDGIGDAGTLKIQADNVILKNSGAVTASTASGKGGNIQFFVDLLLLKGGSISVSALGNGTGGNIDIDTDLFVGFGKNIISANAINSKGGNIRINTQGFFPSPGTKITATSEAGAQENGTVTLNALKIGAEETITRAPDLETSPQLISACNPSTGDSKFVAMGPGALQVEPSHFAETDSILDSPTSQSASNSQTAPPPTKNSIVEATGWTKENGKTVLIAKTKAQSTHASSDPSMCKGS